MILEQGENEKVASRNSDNSLRHLNFKLKISLSCNENICLKFLCQLQSSFKSVESEIAFTTSRSCNMQAAQTQEVNKGC